MGSWLRQHQIELAGRVALSAVHAYGSSAFLFIPPAGVLKNLCGVDVMHC